MFDAQAQSKQTKKLRRPFKYPRALILFILFFKYTLRLPYRQTEGFVRTPFRKMGMSILQNHTLQI
ncbi:MAG: transposase [Aquificaceae bacterium]|nr:transposase [Aquificaceae bacterium]